MKLISSIVLLVSVSFTQPDSRFETFDWTVYRQVGAINSITEAFDFAYVATEDAGILRLSLFHNRFDKPITTAQGLSGNNILAVHYDRDTGILWAANDEFIDFSLNAMGNWFHIKLDETGVHQDSRVIQIGSSNNFVWLNAGSSYVKLDKVSGINLGLFPLPDEDNISWSGKKEYYWDIPSAILDYTFMGGWQNMQSIFLDPYGREVQPLTYFIGTNNNVYIGMDDGTIFSGNTQMETFYPYEFGLNNSSVNAFSKADNIWLVGDNIFLNKGITNYNLRNNEFQHIDFDIEINLGVNSYYSLLETTKEVWLGGNSTISVYNKKKDYWREISEPQGLPSGAITSMADDKTSIWVGTARGIANISKKQKRAIDLKLNRLIGFKKINDIKLYNNNLWIAMDQYLLIYDVENEELISFKQYGNTKSIDNRIDGFFNFSDIYIFDHDLYISTPFGILNYNYDYNDWSMAVEPTAYTGSNINDLVTDGYYCFLGTNSGFWQVSLVNGLSEHYDFPFIGTVQDMYIHGNDLLLGTENGLINYLWKKD